ncbi:hypothetical protein [Stenotrophomonas rhizophila]|uniref:Uncharacterized protein n=1 Tax=Stenotrophomonas rhizophila TaxID=216778 RepID=A0AAW5PEY7_9GAMM|nr:hypothetical protein [Stenotrophomonas rhizophila]MCS4279008.1 hypothetical protein [Stenotrophomonas rhizophila]
MAREQAPESFHSVSLSVSGRGYTANIWRGGATEWGLLSVDIEGGQTVKVNKPKFPSCRAVLQEAEKVAFAGMTVGAGTGDGAG